MSITSEAAIAITGVLVAIILPIAIALFKCWERRSAQIRATGYPWDGSTTLDRYENPQRFAEQAYEEAGK
ncbi:hypothetical protein BJY01DRAFT_251656 [Aspergillus pseudoustus]|uniref:Uncharacterized protein n=1 Tax=Aspergillus pseudoustus TaxID=1810923 RepID=A0ABR4JAR1_9EURO